MPRYRTSVFTLCAFLFLGALLVGCGDTDASEADYTVDEEEGLTIITNTGAPEWDAAESAPLQFDHTQSFGAEEEPAEALLSDASDVAVDDDGSVYILDRRDHRLLAFDAEGTFLWEAGREGQGPGEFQFPNGIGVLPSGNLLILDGTGRLDEWSTEGTHEQSHTPEDLQVRIGSLLHGSDDTVAIVGVDEEFEGLVQILNTETFDVVKTFPVDLEINMALAFMPVMRAGYANGILYLANRTGYQIDVYDATSGERIQQITQPDAEGMVGMGMAQIDQGMRFYPFSAVGAPLYLSDGIRLVPTFQSEGVDDPNEWIEERQGEISDHVVHDAFLDVYDEDYRLQGRLHWSDTRTPDIGQVVAVGPDGALYTSLSEPYPHVRRYKVAME